MLNYKVLTESIGDCCPHSQLQIHLTHCNKMTRCVSLQCHWKFGGNPTVLIAERWFCYFWFQFWVRYWWSEFKGDLTPVPNGDALLAMTPAWQATQSPELDFALLPLSIIDTWMIRRSWEISHRIIVLSKFYLNFIKQSRGCEFNTFIKPGWGFYAVT